MTKIDGTDPRFIVPEKHELDWSPDGEKLVLTDRQSTSCCNKVIIYDLASSSMTNLGPANVGNRSPTWSPHDEGIAVARYLHLEDDKQEIVLIDPVTGSETAFFREFLAYSTSLAPSFRGAFNPEATTPEDLLERYEPVVYYHPDEAYFADAADEAIDWREKVVYEAEPSLVVADHVEGGSNGGLAAQWFRNRVFSDTDVLDEIGDYQEAADWGHGQPALADHVYANEVTSADGEVEWLQYWFFYYYNDSINAEGTSYGTQEGDWEFAQYAYEPDTEQIVQASYNQHEGTETCPSSALEYVIAADGRGAPAVYSAKASHASYFHPGDYDLERGPFNFGNDLASGDAGPTELTLSKLNEEPWFAWEGRWGGTFSSGYGPISVGSTSPSGPGIGANEEELVDPDRVAAEGEDCLSE